MSKSIDREKLYLYLVVCKEAVSATLVSEEEKVQWLVYYVNKRLLDVETRYPELEKLVSSHNRIQKTKVLLSRTLDRGLNQLPAAPSALKARGLR